MPSLLASAQPGIGPALHAHSTSLAEQLRWNGLLPSGPAPHPTLYDSGRADRNTRLLPSWWGSRSRAACSARQPASPALPLPRAPRARPRVPTRAPPPPADPPAPCGTSSGRRREVSVSASSTEPPPLPLPRMARLLAPHVLAARLLASSSPPGMPLLVGEAPEGDSGSPCGSDRRLAGDSGPAAEAAP